MGNELGLAGQTSTLVVKRSASLAVPGIWHRMIIIIEFCADKSFLMVILPSRAFFMMHSLSLGKIAVKLFDHQSCAGNFSIYDMANDH